MKTRTGLALVCLAALAAAAPQTLQFVRKYAVGDVDAYHMTMTMEGAITMDMSMDVVQKVTKVYDDGDADVESTTSGGKVTMAGRDIPIPAGKPTLTRLSKYGAMVSSSATPRGMGGMDFAKYARQMPKDGLAVGQTVTVDETDPTTKTSVKGAYTLESIEKGIARLHTVMDVTTEKATSPMHLDFTTLVEAATGKMSRTEGKVTNVAGAAGMPAGMKIDAVTLVMERKP